MSRQYSYDVPTQIRTTITNLGNGDRIYLQYEPETLTGSVSATYNSDPALGGTHENLMFSHTTNENFSFDLRWNRIQLTALTGKSTDEASRIIETHRAFIRSLVNPEPLVLDVVGGEPPLLNISCPGVFEVYARLLSIDWETARRDPSTGQMLELVMRCTFREDPQYRYTSEDIFDAGYERG